MGFYRENSTTTSANRLARNGKYRSMSHRCQSDRAWYLYHFDDKMVQSVSGVQTLTVKWVQGSDGVQTLTIKWVQSVSIVEFYKQIETVY